MKSSCARILMGLLLGLPLHLCACSEPRGQAEDLLNRANSLRTEAAQSEDGIQPEQWNQIEELIRQAVQKDPACLPAHLALLLTLWDQDKHLDAVRMAEALIVQFPDRHEPFELAGDFYVQINQTEKALDAFQKSIDLGGDMERLLIKRGTAAGRSGQFDLAFDLFEEALDTGAAKEVVFYNFGLCYEGTKQYELALDYYEKSLKENPSYLPVINQLVEFHQKYMGLIKPDIDRALSYAQRAYELDNTDIKVLSNLADIFMVKEDYSSAMNLVEEALKMHPGNPQLEKYKTGLEKLIQQANTKK